MDKIKYLFGIIIIGFIVFFISNFFIQICFVNGESMEPTLKGGQMIFINKIDKSIKANDIVLINKDEKNIIKRIVGIPNDSVEIIDNYIYINNNRFDDNYIQDKGNLINRIVLSENEYFVLGDNRQHSIDSRFNEIGIINKNNIIGKVL